MIISNTEQFYDFKPLEVSEQIFVEDIRILPHLPGIYLLYSPNLERNPYGGMGMDLWDRFNNYNGYIGSLNNKENRPIINALKYYGGIKNFKIEIFHWWTNPVEKIEVEALETEVIHEYNCLVKDGGYNICEFGYSSFGIKRSKEFCEKIVKRQTGRKDSEKTKLKKSNSLKEFYSKNEHWALGTKLSEERKNELRLCNLGSKRSDETKKILSEQKIGDKNPMFGKHPTWSSKDKMSIKQIDKDTGEVIKVWKSINDAARYILPNTKNKYFRSIATAIRLCCDKKRKVIYKYKWEYV